MIAGAKYGHTNLIAKDWRALSRFYQEHFGCTPVPPERDFKGPDLERGTGIPGAELRGCTCGCRPWRGRADPRDLQLQRPQGQARRRGQPARNRAHRVRGRRRALRARGRARRWRPTRGGSGHADDGDRLAGDVGVRDRSRRECDRAPVLVEIATSPPRAARSGPRPGRRRGRARRPAPEPATTSGLLPGDVVALVRVLVEVVEPGGSRGCGDWSWAFEAGDEVGLVGPERTAWRVEPR